MSWAVRRPEPARPQPSRCPILSRLDHTQKAPEALVLCPTRELAIQVCEAFASYGSHMAGLHVLPVYGGQAYGVQLSALRRGVQVVVGTPGRIMDHLEKGTLDLSQLRFLVLDEADEMLKMGFAEDVETILAGTPADKQVALFSATMPTQIRKIAKKYLNDPVEITIKTKTTTVATTTQRYLRVAPAQKLDALTRILEVENFEAMLIFARTKQETEQLAERLRARGFAATALNGDIAQAQRERIVNQLKSGKLDIIVATDVAARGLDVDRISHVVNYDIPTDTESYVHRIGRTGRAGRTGDAISFITPKEFYLLRADREGHPPGTHPDAVADHRRRQQQPAHQVRQRDHRCARVGLRRHVPRHRRPLRPRARRARGGRRRCPCDRAAGRRAAAAGGPSRAVHPGRPRAPGPGRSG